MLASARWVTVQWEIETRTEESTGLGGQLDGKVQNTGSIGKESQELEMWQVQVTAHEEWLAGFWRWILNYSGCLVDSRVI